MTKAMQWNFTIGDQQRIGFALNILLNRENTVADLFVFRLLLAQRNDVDMGILVHHRWFLVQYLTGFSTPK